MNACCLFSLKYCAWLDGKQGFHLMINVRVLAFVFSSWCEQNRLSRVLGEMANFRGADTHSMHEILVSILCLGDKGLNALFSVLSESTHQQFSPGQIFLCTFAHKIYPGSKKSFQTDFSWHQDNFVKCVSVKESGFLQHTFFKKGISPQPPILSPDSGRVPAPT